MERVDVAVIGGGQSGLAAAHALRRQGLEPVVLEAADRPAGSWPRYYDSLTLFSPAGYSSLLATGYRPDLGYLAPLGALDEHGRPLHREGASLTHPSLAYVGLEWQRSLSSNSLRGVGRDANRIAQRLAAYVRRSR